MNVETGSLPCFEAVAVASTGKVHMQCRKIFKNAQLIPYDTECLKGLQFYHVFFFFECRAKGGLKILDKSCLIITS